MSAVIYPILSSLHTPKELKQLSKQDLPLLAQEIRHIIVETMAKNGGHLGSNMGVVELTIALHYLFESPKDPFIFDVSHQTYPHKLLTGRVNLFHTIRKGGGLSGFAHPQESPHDLFYAGHAGTALSLAMGLLTAKQLERDPHYVIPIIGDATLTCGLTLEALNNISRDFSKLIIVLNDNAMSISNNVGAITEILQAPEIAREYFERYHLNYLGPIDGHDFEALFDLFSLAKKSEKPCLVHVWTKKGKGLSAAELAPSLWHGCSPFDKVTSEKVATPIPSVRFPQIFGKSIVSFAEKDPSIFVVTPAMILGSCLTDFSRRFPSRCVDVGIAEGHAVTFSGALAQSRRHKVICCIYSTFFQRAFDNLFQDVALQQSPVIFMLDRAGLAAGDGPTHHGIYDLSFTQSLPHVTICQPRNGQLLHELLASALSWVDEKLTQGPIIIRYPNLETSPNQLPSQKRDRGVAECLREGREVVLVGLGHLSLTALEVASLLEDEGIDATVIDPIFVKPLDSTLFHKLFSSHTCIVTIEEHAAGSGLSCAVNHFANEHDYRDIERISLAIPDSFIEQGSYPNLISSLKLDAPSIAKEILLQRNRRQQVLCLSNPS